MLNRYDWKNIVKRIIIGVGIAFILFNINKCNAYALVYKDSVYGSYTTNGSQSGSLATNQSVKIEYNFNNPNFNLYYDILGLKFGTLNIKTTDNFSLTGNVGVNGIYCTNYTENTSTHTYYCSSTTYTGNSGTISTNNALNSSIIYMSANLHYVIDNVDYYLPCTLETQTDYQWFCPFNKSYGQPKSFDFEVKNGGFDNLTYNVGLNGWKYYYNNDSTEVVNGLTGIQTQQQQTNTIISDTNVSSSQSSANTGFNNMNSQITQQVDSLASINTYNSIINNFFTQINNSTCSPISLPMPFVQGKNIVLPCIGTEINNSAPTLWTFWRFMCAGIIGFALWGNMITFIKGVVDPYNIGANNLPLGGGK